VGVLSYGPCQLPTLGFVVERYLEIKYFKPEDYYFLKAVCVIDENTGIDLKWIKQNTRSKVAISLIYNNMYEKTNGNMNGKVVRRSKNMKKRNRPFPLTTVELQKMATDKLRMSSARIM
jgi:DNA topoisomerase-3